MLGSLLLAATGFGLLGFLSLLLLLDKWSKQRGTFPWDYAAVLCGFACFFCLHLWSTLRPVPRQFAAVGELQSKQADKAFGSVVTLAGGIEFDDPVLKQLFATSGTLGSDEECRSREKELAQLSSRQRDRLVRHLADFLEPDSKSYLTGCALAIAGQLEPMDERLGAPLIRLAVRESFIAQEAANVLRRLPRLPGAILAREILGYEGIGHVPALARVLEAVPADDLAPLRSALSNVRGGRQALLLLALAHAPQSDAGTAEYVRAALQAADDDKPLYLAAVLALPNNLPPEEALRRLRPLVRRKDGPALLKRSLQLAKHPEHFYPLVSEVLETWDQFDFDVNDDKVEVMLLLRPALIDRLRPALERILLVPAGQREHYAFQLSLAAKACYQKHGADGSSKDAVCYGDAWLGYDEVCGGPAGAHSSRVRKLIDGLDEANERLLPQLELLLQSKEPALRDFAIAVLNRLRADNTVRALLQRAEHDASFWIQASAFAAQRSLDRGDDKDLEQRTNSFVRRAAAAGCLAHSAFVVHASAAGEPMARELLSDLRSRGLASGHARALAKSVDLPQESEAIILTVLQSSAVRSCRDEPGVSALVQSLMNSPSPGAAAWDYIEGIIQGRELRCCSDTLRLRTALDALAHGSVRHARARQLLIRYLPRADRLPGGRAEVNRAILRASPEEDSTILREISNALKENDAALRRFRAARSGHDYCPKADGTTMRVTPELSKTTLPQRPTPEQIAAQFAAVAAELAGSSPDYPVPLLRLLQGGKEQEFARKLEQTGKQAVNARDDQCETMLHKALRRGLNQHVELLLRTGADPNIPNRAGISPLMLAAERGDIAQLALLLEHGSVIDMDDRGEPYSRTALDRAVEQQKWEAALFLLERGADPNAGHPPFSPLFAAYRRGQTRLLAELLRRGADPTRSAAEGKSFMRIAQEERDEHTLQLLDQADIDAACREGQ